MGLDNVCKGFLKGQELLQHISFTAKKDLPDLIILDYEMPRMNGKELLKVLQTLPELKLVPVIFYSDKITKELEKELLELGAFCCIKKGITANEQLKFAQAIIDILKK